MALTHDENLELEALRQQASALSTQDWMSPEEQERYTDLVDRISELERRIAIDQMDEIPPAEANTPSDTGNGEGWRDIPPTAGDGDDPFSSLLDTPSDTRPYAIPIDVEVKTAPPVEGITRYLPLTGSSTFDPTIIETDRALDQLNQAAFQVDPSVVNKYDGIMFEDGTVKLKGLDTATNSFDGITAATQSEFTETKAIFDNTSDEPWVDILKGTYAPVFDAGENGAGENGLLRTASQGVTDAGTHASGALDAFHGAIVSARNSIESLYAYDEHNVRYLDETKPLVFDSSSADLALSEYQGVDAAQTSIKDSMGKWTIPDRTVNAPDILNNKPSTKSPSTTTPISSTSSNNPSDASTSEDNGDDSSPPDTPAASSPQQAQTPQATMPQMSMPQTSTPSTPTLPLSEMAQSLNDPGVTELSADAGPTDAPKTPTPGSPVTGDSSVGVVPGTPLRPGDPVRPGQLGADGKLLDKDGDGKMDADAIAPTAENNNDTRTVTMSAADGTPVEVSFADPRTAEIVSRMLEGSTENPVSVGDAARATGLDINGNGRGIDIAEIRIGDVLEGTDRGVIVNTEYVVTEGGELKPINEIMDYDKCTPQAYRIDMPELPSEELLGQGAAEYGTGTSGDTGGNPPPHPDNAPPPPLNTTGDSTPPQTPPQPAPEASPRTETSSSDTPTAPAPQAAPEPPASPVAKESAPEPAAAPKPEPAPQQPASAPEPAAEPLSTPKSEGEPARTLPKVVPYEGKPLGDD